MKLETIESRRIKARLAMTYKIINGLVILNPNLLPKLKNSRPIRECNFAKVGHENQLLEQTSRLKVIGNTFFFSIKKIWNETITPQQAKAPSIEAFKQHF